MKPVTLVIFKDGTINIYADSEKLPNSYGVERTLTFSSYKQLLAFYNKLKNIMVGL